MSSIDDDFAAFEAEINSIVTETSNSETATISVAPISAGNPSSSTRTPLVLPPPPAPVLGGPIATPVLIPSQLRLPPAPPSNLPKAAAVIESAPTKYEEDAPFVIPQTFALPADILYIQHKKNLAVIKKKEKWTDDDKKKKKSYVRSAGGQTWEDPSLADWDSNDFRIFCGDLGNEVSDELLAKAFRKYPSFLRAKVIRDGRTNKSKGYGFASFKNAEDYARAMREMDGKYVGNRPIKLRKSNWKDRQLDVVKTKQKEKKELGLWT